MSKEKLSGAEALMRSLQDEGIELVFGYPGGASLHIYDALFKQQAVQHVLVRHEQGAVHAADGYARSTGKPGVVFVTSGPGATNAITGLATSYMDSTPVIVISSQVKAHLIGTDSFQETDMIGVSRPVVKHSFLVLKAEDIPTTIKKAFHIATTGRPGPVVIDIPKSVTDPDYKFDYSYPKDVDIRSYKPVEEGHSGQIRKAAKLLLASERPVIYAGGGVIQNDASEELIELVNFLNFPVTNTLMGLGAYPATGDKFIGMLGMHGTYEANMAMHNSDLILAVGARFDDRITNDPAQFALGAKKIHIDIDPASLSKIIKVDVPIVGSAKSCLRQLLNELKKNESKLHKEKIEPWLNQIQDWRNEHGLNHDMLQKPSPSGKILPQQVIQSLYKETKGKAYITSDVGQHQMFTAQYYHFDKPRQWINSGGLGTMGFGLPAAMGVQLAFPRATVACVTGEGSIQMCIQELSTCLQYDLPIKIINVNNSSLGMVKQWQDMQYGGRLSQTLYEDSLPDFVKLAESFGHVGMKVEKLEELESAMKDCFKLKNKLVFLDIVVDQDEHVYPMLEAGMALDAMWLDKETKTWE
ncbi:MAG TPA: acetolactate synthase 3 large subunit [Gammaproteobacteria bacterium]|jgi:acetolactate synthase-1/2/3 large subunit|nr:acetolactate synthase 3 large subunit [Gammaproteobacteria bacterium]HIA42805.1 acetolactate synthase 3 large subunit [Gammaproteobacteria bacterium]HIA96029.1 acetolactate synthase 3 large subunit [Gammaproteobacteria bacterium]HIB75372.1 acetolactate synthase 3 large subunit [Gammaproteobacteria bacterium]HIM21548.1 acetolactate synthase 3 large subunit [Gammaproteobacteria bacterium]